MNGEGLDLSMRDFVVWETRRRARRDERGRWAFRWLLRRSPVVGGFE